jgi:hypothetical protein
MKGRKTSNENKTLNAKQKSYWINLLTIGGGAALYTEWQIVFPLNTDVPYYSFIQQASIITISATMLAIAFFSQKEDNNENNNG